MRRITKKIFKHTSLPESLIAPLLFCLFGVTAVYIVFSVSDAAAYWVSAILFFFGALMSFFISRTAGLDGALTHFREVIIGSINVGLTSIKKLSDTPPETIAIQTKSSMQFMGVAGEKFLKTSLESGDFFRRNKNPEAVRIMLMDPFSDDIARLSNNKSAQEENRNKIISTIGDLHELQNQGYIFEVRLYPKLPPLRLLISDSSVTALSIYAPDTSGWKNAQLIFNTRDCPDSLAPYFFELFDDLWERGLNFNLSQRANSLVPFVSPRQKNEVTKVGMVHGRFQPFHHEHFEYVLNGISKTEKCLIGITQPNIGEITDCDLLPHRGTPEGNPYSFEERADMISLSLRQWGVPDNRYEIIPFDIDHPDVSIQAIKENNEDVVQFMRLFSEWELHKKKLFNDAGMKVEIVRSEASQFSKKNVTGTLVRELIASNRNWQDFVPTGTKTVISKHAKHKSRG